MQLGQWVHCTCGCTTSGLVVDMRNGEVSIQTALGTRVYPEDKLAPGAICNACGKTAVVVFTVADDDTNFATGTMCLDCFSRAGMGVMLEGMHIAAASVLPESERAAV